MPGTILDIDTPMASGQISTAKPAKGPAMPMSNRMRLERMAERMRMNGSQGSDQSGSREEKRQRGIDVIITGGEVVAELVGHQNGEQGERERQARRARKTGHATCAGIPRRPASKSKGRPWAKLCAIPDAHHCGGQQRD